MERPLLPWSLGIATERTVYAKSSWSNSVHGFAIWTWSPLPWLLLLLWEGREKRCWGGDQSMLANKRARVCTLVVVVPQQNDWKVTWYASILNVFCQTGITVCLLLGHAATTAGKTSHSLTMVVVVLSKWLAVNVSVHFAKGSLYNVQYKYQTFLKTKKIQWSHQVD